MVIGYASSSPRSDTERVRQLEEQLRERDQQLRWAELKVQALEGRLRLQLIGNSCRRIYGAWRK
jgi:hypothetical protein